MKLDKVPVNLSWSRECLTHLICRRNWNTSLYRFMHWSVRMTSIGESTCKTDYPQRFYEAKIVWQLIDLETNTVYNGHNTKRIWKNAEMFMTSSLSLTIFKYCSKTKLIDTFTVLWLPSVLYCYNSHNSVLISVMLNDLTCIGHKEGGSGYCVLPTQIVLSTQLKQWELMLQAIGEKYHCHLSMKTTLCVYTRSCTTFDHDHVLWEAHYPQRFVMRNYL